MKTLTYLGMFALAAACGQSGSPAFQSVELRASTAKGDPAPANATFENGEFTMRAASVADMIAIAYGVHDYSLAGAPGWVQHDRYDLTAHTPATTPGETVKLMLRTVLSSRFELASHAEEKPMNVFALTTGKGAPKMTPGDVAGVASCQLRQLPPKTPGLVTDNIYECRNMTMDNFASTLHGLATSYLTSPVVDLTRLKGAWNFDIAWTSRGSLQITGGAGVTLSEAVDKQLGLKLEEQKRPMTMMVIDHVEKPAGV